VKYWEIIADNLSKAGWSWGCISAVDSRGRTIFVADAHRGDGQRFIVCADEKLTAFLEIESASCAWGEGCALKCKRSLRDDPEKFKAFVNAAERKTERERNSSPRSRSAKQTILYKTEPSSPEAQLASILDRGKRTVKHENPRSSTLS
jgi:hypothetical protein